MTKTTWSKGNLHISYDNPTITPYYTEDDAEKEVKSMDDAMYFYYDIDIMCRNKVLLSTRTHDFPKVQYLPDYIDHIMNNNMKKAYVIEDYEQDGFHRKIKYIQTMLEDDLGLDMEYFLKIERYDYAVKQFNEAEYNKWTEYNLTIGEMEDDDENGHKESFGRLVIVKDISPEDLISLKNTALSFCSEAIDLHNKQ